MSDAVVVEALERLLAGGDLDRVDAERVLHRILSGEVGQAQIAAILVALRAKGETAEEIAGLAAAIRRHATPVATVRQGLVDTCGTGGGASTFNISTAVALAAAGAGVPVAKHGNRGVTSRSGSADVLESLGVRVDLDAAAVGACLDEVGFAFMFAPAHHPAFRHVGPVRAALGVRTVFNLLGPLANPAGASRQMIGVYDRAFLDRIGGALVALGTERALVVCGRDGIDEISVGAPTDVVEVAAGRVRRLVIDPTELGIPTWPLAALAGGGPDGNARIIRAVLAGARGAHRDVVVVNAAAVLWLSDRAADLPEGVARAVESIDSGAAAAVLESLVDATARLAPVAA